MKTKFFTLILACVLVLGVKAQEPENPVEPQSAVPSQCEDVLLQGFYWDSYRGRSSYGSTHWTTLYKQAQEIGRYFDLVWLPPSSLSADGNGYQPKQYSNQNSAWGTRAELEQLISALHNEGTKVIADVVLNHIVGDSTWCDFMPQDFDQYGLFQPDGSYICNTDEMNAQETMEYAGDCWGTATGAQDDGENYFGARDWAHDNPDVQDMFKAYLKWMKNVMHYDGWRYDKGDGYYNWHMYNYNQASEPYIAFEERFDGNVENLKNGIRDAQMNMMALDFALKFDGINAMQGWNYVGRRGLIGKDDTGSDYWKKHAVTWVDNHDMFLREDNDLEFCGRGNSMKPEIKARLLGANAFILAMPGVPCIFYPHWYKYKAEIKDMINARHLAGVHSESEVKDEYWDSDGSRATGYQATIVGKNGYLILCLGTKTGGNFDGYTKVASLYSTFNDNGNLINESYEMWVYCIDTASYINNDTTYAPVVEDQFSISVNGDSRQGTVAGGGMYYYYDTCVVEAIPHEGLRFVQWNDGNTDNPRMLYVTKDSTFTAEFGECFIASGMCGAQGDNLTWELGCDSVLTISGSGEMYQGYGAPWNEYKSVIKAVVIGDSVTNIGMNAFSQCTALTTVSLPESVVSIGEGAFEGCTSLPVIDNLRYVGNYLVEAADKTLNTYTIREGTKWIGSHAFSECAMTSINIPNSVTEIQGAAFYRCSSLRSIELPSGLTRIAHQTFLLCDSLTSVVMPNNVTEIDYWAFEDCRSLESIVIPDSVVYIWYGAFAGCRSLTSITIPSSVLEFSYNPRHKDAPAAFAGCTGLTAINVSPYNPNYCSIDGVVFTKDVQKLIQYPGGKQGAYTIPDGVRVIEEWSFSECYGLSSVTIPNSVRTMKDFAFSYCYGLSSVTIPSSVDTLGYGVFEGCSGLTSITCEAVELPSMDGDIFDGVDKSIPLYVPAESIEYYRAANEWKNFTNILPIPSVQYTISVAVNDSNYGTAYGSGTFAEDSTVLIWATPNYGYHFARWSDGSRTNPRRIEVTQDSTFIAYFAVDRIGYCGDSLALIWEYDATAKALTISGNGALNSNYTFGAEAPTAVENLIIAEGVTAIGQNAFANYATIKHISVPTTVARIHSQAFYDCVGLEEIYSYRETPCVAYSNTFDGIDKFSCTLHVLSASVSKYQIATGWRDFPNIQTIDAQTVTEVIEEVETVPADNNVTITWPVSEGADTYTILVSKDGVVVCRLIFDANGQLLGIAFAPGRRGGAQAPAAVKTENGGLRFTITGLESGTDYQVTVIAKDENEEVVEEYVSDFTTSGAEEDTPTGFDTIGVTNQATKLIRNGQIFILRGDKTYTVTGQEVR